MDAQPYARCTYMDETFMFFLDIKHSFSDIVREVCLGFKSLKHGSFDLRYAFPRYSSCVLSNDVDLTLMWRCMYDFKLQSVDFLVKDCGSSSVSSVVTHADDYSCISSSISVLPSSIVDGPEYLGHYRPERARIYLTNEWQGFIKNELDNNHTCKGVLREKTSSHLGSHVVKSEISNELKANPTLKPRQITDRFKHSFGLDILYRSAWYARELARKDVHGDDGNSYSQLLWYRDAILESNPGSYCRVEINPLTNRFERLFICFSGCIQGFQSCIPLLFVDAAHLKSKYKGYMLCAIGKNGNQEFFPFAFAIVDSENNANWKWFFDHLYNILSTQGRIVTFVTYRNGGLLNAVASVFPDSPHSYCYYHLKGNVRALYRNLYGYFVDKVVEEFMKVAYSPTIASYNFNLQSLKREGGKPTESFLTHLPLDKWCNAFFRGSRYGEMANSIVESFNRWCGPLRELPVFDFLEGLRVKVMDNMSERKVECKKWNTVLCPPMEALLKKFMDVGRHWPISMSSETFLEVHAENRLLLILRTALVLAINGKSIHSHVQTLLLPSRKLEIYLSTSSAVVQPPLVRRPSGRPKSVRMKSAAEGGTRRTIRCGRCGQLGRHNKATCTAPI
ncbi:hypothetical protein ACLB2K_050644 [Fragaria x ananassa]